MRSEERIAQLTKERIAEARKLLDAAGASMPIHVVQPGDELDDEKLADILEAMAQSRGLMPEVQS